MRHERLMVAMVLYALSGGVLWWTTHLLVLSILVGPSCEHGIGWTMNVVTGATAVGALSAVWASLVVRADDAAVVQVNGRSSFLGHVALLFNGISLGLILVEGVPVWFIGPCA